MQNSLNQVSVGARKSLHPQRIVRLQADRNYTLIHKENGDKLLVSITLKIIEERLLSFGFLRLTRGDVVNLDFIENIRRDGSVELMDGTRIAPSRRRRKAVLLLKHPDELVA